VVGLLGLVVVLLAAARPDEAAPRLLMLSYAGFTGMLVLPMWVYLLPDLWPWLQRATILCAVLSSAALLHFLLVFPASSPALGRLADVGRPLLHRIGGGTLLIYAVPLLVTLGITSGPLGLWMAGYLVCVVLVALGLVALVRSYRHPPTALARAQLKWI